MILLPTTARDFVSLMEDIWDQDKNDLYHTPFCNANHTIKACGAVPTDNYDDDCQVWQFPNGEQVSITRDGNGLG